METLTQEKLSTNETKICLDTETWKHFGVAKYVVFAELGTKIFTGEFHLNEGKCVIKTCQNNSWPNSKESDKNYSKKCLL